METSVGDKMEILFELHTDDAREVEQCVKLLMRKYIYRGSKKEYYETSIKQMRNVIKTCHGLIKDETYCNQCQSDIDNDIMSHVIDKYHIDEDEILHLQIGVDDDLQKGGNLDDCLLAIPVENPLVIEKFSQIHLYPYFTHDNCYYECKINHLKKILESCKQNANIDQNINQLLADGKVDPNETVLIDIPSAEQSGGAPRLSSEEFGKKIIVMDDGMILPNGCILYHTGKVAQPHQKPNNLMTEFVQTAGSDHDVSNKQHQMITKSKTFQWLYDSN